MKKLISALSIGVLLLFTTAIKAQTMEKDVTVIELIQTTGAFQTNQLNLTPGKYQFRVVNKDVDKDLGFVIQKEQDKNSDVMETALVNSFTTVYVKKGTAEYTGIVELNNGSYVYSCPLNPTPHYRIVVK